MTLSRASLYFSIIPFTSSEHSPIRSVLSVNNNIIKSLLVIIQHYKSKLLDFDFTIKSKKNYYTKCAISKNSEFYLPAVEQ